MKSKRRPSRPICATEKLHFNRLEPRNMLANDVLPDVFAWESEERGYLHDYVVEGDLLRFTTAFANQGDGHLEVFGGEVNENGNQEVWQRIYNDEGGHRDRLAGEFTYHEGHGHIHFDGYAIYNLREIGPAGEVGDIIATGGKISFCLIDITRYDPNAGSSNYGGCGTTQGVSAGWSDVYGRGLSDQWINIAGVADGDYYLEVVTDPEDKLLESDETNNTTIITVTIEDGPGDNGDRFEVNNTFETAYNFGMVSSRHDEGISIHTDQDVDYYQFNAVDHGEFSIHVNFSHDLGNLDAFVYDADFNLIASSETLDDLEDLHFHTHPDVAYYLQVVGVEGATNGYDLEFDGPGELVTDTRCSDDVPVDIPDSGSASTEGVPAITTIEGPDITLTDLNLILEDISHTYMGDLHFELTSPLGTTAVILRSTWENESGPLGSGDNFTGTWIDDQGPTNIADGNSPHTGTYNVNYGDVSNPLSVFNGESALGTWTLSVSDWYPADTGTINDWCIMFTGIDNNPGDVFEQNDAFPQATDLGTIGLVSYSDLSIHRSSDVDFFRFEAQDSTHLQLDLSFIHDDGNLDVVVYDSNQEVIARGDTINDDESLTIPVIQDELYFVEVYGFEGDRNNYSLTLDVPNLIAQTGYIGNVGETWTTVVFEHSFDNPVVVVSTPGSRDSSPVTVDIGNVTSDSFDVRLNGWDSATETHGPETLSYFVVEAGVHELRDGTIIQAGHHAGLSYQKNVVRTGGVAAPIVFAQLENSSEFALTPRLYNVNENGFGYYVTGEEAASPRVAFNSHWINVSPGISESEAGLFEAGLMQDVTHKPNVQFLSAGFSAAPGVLSSIQTVNDRDVATPRLLKVRNSAFLTYLQEETSRDSETAHGPEQLGYLAFAIGEFYESESDSQSLRFSPDIFDDSSSGSFELAIAYDVFDEKLNGSPIGSENSMDGIQTSKSRLDQGFSELKLEFESGDFETKRERVADKPKPSDSIESLDKFFESKEESKPLKA